MRAQGQADGFLGGRIARAVANRRPADNAMMERGNGSFVAGWKTILRPTPMVWEANLKWETVKS